ncbi:hypothetical protein CGRA01v4_03931 [Colletotrichum graminicola]|uniref:Uncharacterized protein n=1 Tax=Colletotrichum graminicola (strain M1.001 / M2 / FGSC 10212) TaxID=645133 RepID=E3QTT6_COLGM|nr:uncharacterized protein GLRG_09392 [Colletotrichum graminicola M1.001]EFQ34248.1 hypothetical protein GLRG_09392 [Colletotrichum graminicola M1.001]WDK12651.1 hypothetical protein CGRA01v4_03931 [Colletotrichum graminicola]
MAQPLKRPLTEAELRRAEDCADENAKLAECWESHQVAIVTCEPADELSFPSYLSTSVLTIETLLPLEQPTPGSPDRKKKQQQQKMREPKRDKRSESSEPRPCYFEHRSYERLDVCTQVARLKASMTFDTLAKEYGTVCIAGYDLRETRRAMESLSIETPARVVWVDLMKVLEHQARGDAGGIPAELHRYTDDNVTVRNGRYDRVPGRPQGYYGMPSVRLLEVLGPAAAAHRADFKKMEKESAALKRMANKARNGSS